MIRASTMKWPQRSNQRYRALALEMVHGKGRLEVFKAESHLPPMDGTG